jgi:hypothetical protein
MKMMPCQYQMLKEALWGYLKTGIPFIAYDGELLKPVGLGDDIGLYYFIPKISHLLGISINQSVDLLFMSMIIGSLTMGIIGLCLILKNIKTKVLGMLEIMLLTYWYYFLVGGIYIIFLIITIAVIPLLFYFSRKQKINFIFIVFLLFSGVAIEIANIFRSHAGTGVLIFMLIILVFYVQSSWKQKMILLMFVAIGVLAPSLFFHQILDKRDMYLKNLYPNYKVALRGHPFWHTAYIGFGFLNNEFGIKYKDEIAIGKVKSISPETAYLSEEYETILRNETLNLIRTNRLFVFQSIFAKVGVIFLYLLVFANVGLIATIFYKKDWRIEMAFWSGMIFNSLFGILAIPSLWYLMGFITLAVLYGIFSIDEALTNITWRQIAPLFYRKVKKS